MEDGGISAQDKARFSDPKWGTDFLAKIRIFKAFSPDELLQLFKKAQLKFVPAGSHAVLEGEQSRGLHLICSGQFSVLKNDHQTGQMYRLSHLEAGQFFGDLSLFDHAPRSATVVADIPSFLSQFSGAEFDGFLLKGGDALKVRFYKACAEDMAERFRLLNADYIQSQQRLWQRVFSRDDTQAVGA